ncbi:MAG: NAD(P)/FAD-dependent oxidoreductase [Bacillales bacterium]|nr:NAD(P)/FAD-dependent oxidoreductase [Bacillales bacterium]
MKVIVLGAGPCGIMAAIKIKKENPSIHVILIDKEQDIGSRIKVSGNGKCNLGNVYINKEKYNHPSFMEKFFVYKEEFFSLLDEVGFSYFYDKEGRIYPTSESSLSLIHSLHILLNKYGVDIKTKTFIKSIKCDNNEIYLESEEDTFYCDKLVLCIGGISYLNDRTNYFNLIKPLTNQIVSQTPSLTPIYTSRFDKELDGRRMKGVVSLLYKGRTIKEEKGEILFKKDGVSGICVFNISSFLARLHTQDYQDYELSLDLLNDISYVDYLSYLRLDESLINLFHPYIARYIVNNHLNPKDLRLKVKGLYDFKNSQVTCGGVSIDAINVDLSLKDNHNIFIGGETIDIDGECGGFNIEYAFLSGLYIGGKIYEEK